MSLINEALKKAQRARHPSGDGGAADANGLDAGVVRSRARPRSESRTWLLIGFGVVGGIALIAAIAVVFVTRSPSSTTASSDTQPPAISPAPITSPVTVAEEPAAPETAVAEAPPASAAAVEPPPTSEAASAPVAVPVETASPPEAAATVPASATPALERPGPAGPNPAIYDYLDQLRVTGIRASDTDPKVLMNDRVYRVGDLVNRALGLRVTGIQPEKLTFTDESGVVYTKEF